MQDAAEIKKSATGRVPVPTDIPRTTLHVTSSEVIWQGRVVAPGVWRASCHERSTAAIPFDLLIWHFSATSITGWSAVHVATLAEAFSPTDETWEMPWLHTNVVRSIRESPPVEFVAERAVGSGRPNLAQRIRDLSGLDVTRLAELFHVSRPAFHGWLNGREARSKHIDHLLEVEGLLLEAVERFPEVSAFREWLLAPAIAGGVPPFEYLASRRVDTFRGFLLRTKPRTSFFAGKVESKLDEFAPSKIGMREARRRLSPPSESE